MTGDESWREAFPEVPTDELDAPGMWSDPNFSLSKSANIGKFWKGAQRERETERSWPFGVRRRGDGKRRRQGARKARERKAGVREARLRKRAAMRRLPRRSLARLPVQCTCTEL